MDFFKPRTTFSLSWNRRSHDYEVDERKNSFGVGGGFDSVSIGHQKATM